MMVYQTTIIESESPDGGIRVTCLFEGDRIVSQNALRFKLTVDGGLLIH